MGYMSNVSYLTQWGFMREDGTLPSVRSLTRPRREWSSRSSYVKTSVAPRLVSCFFNESRSSLRGHLSEGVHQAVGWCSSPITDEVQGLESFTGRNLYDHLPHLCYPLFAISKTPS